MEVVGDYFAADEPTLRPALAHEVPALSPTVALVYVQRAVNDRCATVEEWARLQIETEHKVGAERRGPPPPPPGPPPALALNSASKAASLAVSDVVFRRGSIYVLPFVLVQNHL